MRTHQILVFVRYIIILRGRSSLRNDQILESFKNKSEDFREKSPLGERPCRGDGDLRQCIGSWLKGILHEW